MNAEGVYRDGSAGVHSTVCVENTGKEPTQDIQVISSVEVKPHKGDWSRLAEGLLDTSAAWVLQPGQTYCYSGEILFEPVDGAKYRNVVSVTITNHAGWMPGGSNCPGPDLCPHGPEVKADFSLPEASLPEGGSRLILPVTETPTPSETPIPTGTGTELPTETPEATATATLEPSQTPPPADTPLPAPTVTPLPPATEPPLPAPTVTNTPEPPPTATAEPTAVPTETEAPTSEPPPEETPPATTG